MVSKEVKNARTFETTFLSFYQLYLSLLDLYLTHKIPSNYSYIAFRDEIVCLSRVNLITVSLLASDFRPAWNLFKIYEQFNPWFFKHIHSTE